MQIAAKPAPAPQRLRTIDALLLDCDGVLTDGAIPYDTEGKRSLSFYARDGLGLAMLTKAGVKVAVISGRPVDIAELRHRELGVGPFVGRCKDKGAAIAQVCDELGVEPMRCAFMGDDLADLPAMAACGLSIAVADAAREVVAFADWVTDKAGGRGAVREVCEALLQARGDWQRLVAQLSRKK